jgi:hypothetical protein
MTLRLEDLPAAPAGLRGWPWTTEAWSSGGPAAADRGLPRISVVTPSLNQAQFLEETIRSVLLQGYPHLEYIVMDGGSRDGSVEIIERYSPWLTYWESEPDRGQSHAINKGFAKASGRVLAWLNSDDSFEPGALRRVVDVCRAHPESLVAGAVQNVGPDGYQRLVRPRDLAVKSLVAFWRGRAVFHQPGIFFPADAVRRVGGLDEGLRYAMDYDLLCRLLQVADAQTLAGAPLARFRLHPASKTVAERPPMFAETATVSKRYWHVLDEPPAVLEQELTRFATDHLVRSAGTAMLRGDPASAAKCHSRSLQFGVRMTAAALVTQAASGLRRTIVSGRSR